jgi:type II secretory pathway component PulF
MRRAWYGLKLNMPVVRAVELAWATNLFFRNLSLTTGMGGTSVVHMLTMACDGIANDVIRDDFMRARRLLVEGQSWEDALGQCRLLAPQYREAVAIGERSGNLPEALADVARTAGDELVFRLGILNRIIQRLTVLAVYVAIVATALTLLGAAFRQT